MKISLKILLFFLLLNISCSSDNNNNSEESTNLLIGSWKVSQELLNDIEQTLTDCDKQDDRIFSSNGRFLFNFHVEVPPNIPCFNDGNEEGNWEHNENILKLIWDEFDSGAPQIEEFEILELTNNTLRLGIFSENLNAYLITVYNK